MDKFLNPTDSQYPLSYSSPQKWSTPTIQSHDKTINQYIQTRKFAVIFLLVNTLTNYFELNLLHIDFIYTMGFCWVVLFDLFTFYAQHSEHSFTDGNFVYF